MITLFSIFSSTLSKVGLVFSPFSLFSHYVKKSELETNFGVEGKMKQEKESPGARMDGVKILNESKQKYKRNYLNEGSRHKKSESSNGRGTSNQQERTYYRSKLKE